MIRVLLWDIDNTLLNFPAAERLAPQAAFRDFALGPCPEDRVARYAALNAGYWRRLERGEITKAELLTQRFQVFFQQEGLPAQTRRPLTAPIRTIWGRRWSFWTTVTSCLRDLHSQVKQYAVTNGSQRVQEKKLARSGLGAWLDGVFISETLGGGKAQPGLFPAGAPGHWPLGEGGDPPHWGLPHQRYGRGHRAGIPCCWYNPQGQPLPGDLDIRYDIRNLNEVREIVAGNR